jgi:cytidine deaminase
MALSQGDIDQLVAEARKVREQAYVPYSHFPVGAALRSEDGAVYTGCNVENASFGLTICAERNAMAHAVAQGARRIEAVAVVTSNGVTPCGACRQVLAEFGPDMTVVIEDLEGHRRQYSLRQLLFDGFGPKDLPA